MIKILQILSSSGLGGGERVAFEIIKPLKDDFEFIVAAPSGAFLKKLAGLGVKTGELKERKIFRIAGEIRKKIKKENPDILHLHGTRAAFWGRLAVIGLKNRPKIVYTLHGFHIIRRNFFSRWLLLVLERFLNHWTDVLVCVSEADKELILKYKTIAKDKVVVIKNGIDIERFAINGNLMQDAKEKLGLRGKFIITSIGRLHVPKDFSTLLGAVALLAKEIKDFCALIVGDGPQREQLEEEVRELKIAHYVKFLGARQDIPQLLHSSDIVVLSTNWEGLPLVPLEAGACRKPVIASNVDGVRETVVDGQTGLLFEKGSPKDLAEKILELFESEDLRKKMGENAFRFVSENFSKEKMVQRYKELYQSLKQL